MAKRVLVLQSYKPPPWAEWRRLCINSVQEWAATKSYTYRFIGDELFAPIPEQLMSNCQGVLLPLTDIGRLLWLQKLLIEGWDRVIWLDADILIFDPPLDIGADVVGREVWISKGLQDGFRAASSVNNCVVSVTKDSGLLDELLNATLSEAKNFSDPPHPRALGPDLLRRLDAETPLAVAPDIAMASPILVNALACNDPAPLSAHHSVWGGPVRAVNLCGSLIKDEDVALEAVISLLEAPARFSPRDKAAAVEIVHFA